MAPTLLTLPPEIRNQIYTLALTSPFPISTQRTSPHPRRHSDSTTTSSAPSLWWTKQRPAPAPRKALLDTCRQLRLEGASIYYGINAFVSDSAAELLRFADCRPVEHISQIPSLEITLLRHDLSHLPLWNTLASPSFAGLTHLSLNFRPSFTEAWLCEKILAIESLRSVRLGAVLGIEVGEAAEEGWRGSRRWGAVRFEMEERALEKWEVEIRRRLAERNAARDVRG